MIDKTSVQTIIIGGGVTGLSIAYHLSKMGQKDILLLEKNMLTHGATWHAAGLVGQLRNSRNTTRMLQKSIELYDRLEKETGQIFDWKKVGSLRLASSKERMKEIKRSYTLAKSFGLEMHLISPAEARELFPLISLKNLLGAAFIPGDGHLDPSGLTQALARGAKNRGVVIREGVKVTGFKIANKRIEAVITNKGEIRCEKCVNATGMWGQEIGNLARVNIPVCSLEHQYLVTDDIPGIPKDMPTMRDPDNLVYYKQEMGGLVVGGYELETLPFGERGISPTFGQELLPENMDRFEQLAVKGALRTPVLNEVGFKKLINGPIPSSADGDFVMGRTPELDNFFVAAGIFYGIAAAGGVGQMMAEWMIYGEPSLDLWPLDVRRFNTHHGSRFFMFPRALERYGKHYLIHYPLEENKKARMVRLSPLYSILKEKGAVYGSKGGWERPNWFAPEGVEPIERPSFEKANWFEHVGMEHHAVRKRVGIIDQTSFSKFEVIGPSALSALQKLAVTNLDKPVGHIVYTQLCNERGGIEADLTISRIGENHFYIVTGSTFGNHDLSWIRSNISLEDEEKGLVVIDVTSSKSVLNLCGPYAREVLSKVCDDDISNENFKFSRAKELTIGAAPVLALRIGYVGELGYELHVPNDFALYLYELLMEAGQKYGIANIGYRAIDSLRMEKGYLYWSGDITPDYNSLEAGLAFKISFKSKGDFIGRAALEKIKREGISQKLCTFTIDQGVMGYGNETIYHNDQVIGITTSVNYGYTIGKTIAMGYIPVEKASHKEYQIEILNKSYTAVRQEQVLYDPQMHRLKC